MSYSFDGTNDQLRGTFGASYNSVPLTIACYIKTTGHPAAVDHIVVLGASAALDDHSQSIRTGSGDDTWAANSDSGTAAAATTGAVNVDNTWVGLVGVFTSDSLRNVYIQDIGNTAQSTATRDVTDALLHIAIGEGLEDTNDFNGLIAEVAMWNAALSTQEITDYLAGNIATSIASANLIGYWPLSQDGVLTNSGSDSDGDLTASNAVFNADHPTITTPGASTRRRRLGLMGMG